MPQFVSKIRFRATGSDEVTATGQSNWFTVDEYDELVIFLRVTAIKTWADETFNVKVQTIDPDGNAVDLTDATFAEVTDTVGNEYIAIVVFGSRVRLVWTITGSDPGYTFSATAYAKGVK